jgi:hypothetical protein
MILRGLPVCTRVRTCNTDFGNDAAALDKSLDPRLQLLIQRWQALSPAVHQQIMLYLSSVSPWNCQATNGR